MSIAVIGAAGQTGTEVLRALAERGHGAHALVHRLEQEGHVRQAGAARATAVELARPATLVRALAGASALMIVPPMYARDEPEYVAGACKAAREAGVERVVLHSVLHPFTPAMPHHLRKAHAELAVRESGLRWTILQPAMYAQTPLRLHHPGGDLCVPFSPDAAFTVVDLRDVAQVAGAVLTGDGHDFATYELAGGEVLSSRDMARQLTLISGRPVQVRRVRPWDLALPEAVAQRMGDFAAMCEEYDRHGLLGNPAVIHMLLGRPPRTFADAARGVLGVV